MKRIAIVMTPLIAFALAAMLAWFTGPPVENAHASANSISTSPPHRVVTDANLVDTSSALDQFEYQILHHPAPPVEIHDAEGMEAVLDRDDWMSSFPHGGMGFIEYSMEWAEESPDEMFAWLIHQGGSSVDRRLSPACFLFGKWAAKDMEGALAAVNKIPNNDVRRQALASSLEVLCSGDPDRARELMMQNLSLFPPDGKGSVFKPYDTGKATCEMLLSLPPGQERTHLLANLLGRMASWSIGEEPKTAISIWKNATEATRREWVEAGFGCGKENATSFDGLENLTRERAEATGDRAEAEKFVVVQGPAWAKRDLTGAFAWSQAHLKGKNRVEKGAELFEYAAGQDLDNALRVWQELPEEILKDRSGEALSKGAPAERKKEAEELVRSQPVPKR